MNKKQVYLKIGIEKRIFLQAKNDSKLPWLLEKQFNAKNYIDKDGNYIIAVPEDHFDIIKLWCEVKGIAYFSTF